MQTVGTYEDGDLVLRRHVAETPEFVWKFLTESELLERWFGTWTGDPSTGTVDVTMNAEPGSDMNPSRYTIVECEAPHILMVQSPLGDDVWTLSVRLIEQAEGTTVVLRHHGVPIAMLGEVGPGWDWYLDRLVAVLADGEPPTLTDFDERYLPQADRYRGLLT